VVFFSPFTLSCTSNVQVKFSIARDCLFYVTLCFQEQKVFVLPVCNLRTSSIQRVSSVSRVLSALCSQLHKVAVLTVRISVELRWFLIVRRVRNIAKSDHYLRHVRLFVHPSSFIKIRQE
jgi:hypothetical protein